MKAVIQRVESACVRVNGKTVGSCNKGYMILFGAAKGDQNNPRIVRTEASPYQVAKSRFSIPAELPLDADAVLYSIKQAQNEANS